MSPDIDQKLLAISPRLSAVLPFFSGCDKFGLTSPERWAMFLANCAHESANFAITAENLNYSAQGLANTWPKEFAVNRHATLKIPNALAMSLAHKPANIAANKYGHLGGNKSPADGWNFRGGGFLQLTFRSNYAAASQAIYGNDTLLLHPRLIEKVPAALFTAAWFFQRCLPAADARDLKHCRLEINGGLLGLDAVTSYYSRFCRALNIGD